MAKGEGTPRVSEQAFQLLALLGSGVRPFDAVDATPVDITVPDFGTMLARARSGNPQTGLAVALPHELESALSIVDREALAGAVDRAAVVGAESVLVKLDERILRIDVRTRTVLEEIARSDLDPIEGIDAFVQTPGLDESGELIEKRSVGDAVIGLAHSVRNASLVRALPGDASV